MEIIMTLKPVSVLYLCPLCCGKKLECLPFQYFRLVRKMSQGKTLQLISPGANIIKKFTAGKLQIFIINKPFQDGIIL